MKTNKVTLISLIIAILSFSSYEVVSKTVVGHIDPTQLTFLRYLTGGLFLLPFAFADLKKRQKRITGRDLLNLFALGVLNVAVSMNIIQIGYQHTDANLAAIIISSNPIFVALISSFILKEHLSFKKIAGLSIGIAGVLIAMGGTGNLSEPDMLYGIMLQVIGMLAFSLYTVFGKKTSQKLGSSVMTAFSDLFGALAVLPLVLAKGVQPFSFDLGPIWIQMIYICIFNTGIAFYLYFRALESLDTSLGAMSFLVKPLLASLIAAVFLGETLSYQIFFGIFFVSAGIYLVLLSTKDTKLQGRRNKKRLKAMEQAAEKVGMES